MVVGAGAAGLATAEVLAREGRHVVVLEGRSRIGGRVHTVQSQYGLVPVELGAEFIHGENVCTWEFIRAAGLPTHSLPDRHWRFTAGKLTEASGFYEELEQVVDRVNPAAPDQDVQTFLERANGLSGSAKALAKDYVEGFHAAPADRMSVRALARAEATAEEDGEGQFRLTNGYSSLLNWFEQRLEALGVEIRLDTVVNAVRWKPGRVEVLARTAAGVQTFRASQAVITVPLGVLQAQGLGAVVFEPALRDKQEAIRGLAMGSVLKLTLQFQSRFWPVENFGFIHADGAPLATWWSDERGPILTGWAGGPRAERLNAKGQDALLTEALGTLGTIFHVEPRRIRELLQADFTYDWLNDPLARGAYSYPPVGMGDMPQRLAAPVSGTLFFAGEATDPRGDLGTVHGALGSGRRAAREVLEVGAAERVSSAWPEAPGQFASPRLRRR